MRQFAKDILFIVWKSIYIWVVTGSPAMQGNYNLFTFWGSCCIGEPGRYFYFNNMAKKDAYYFPHFSNARNDRKVSRLKKELGIEGYGIYFMLLEVLRDQDGYKYPISDIDLLADEFGTSEQKTRVVICNYQLFVIDDDNNFFSPKFIEFLTPYIERSKRAVDAAHKRWVGCKSKANAYANALPGQCDGNASKVKESKVKESKEDREKRFYNNVGEFASRYPAQTLRKFYDYWSEPELKGDKMRFEMQKTWDTGRRLATWQARESKDIPMKNSNPQVKTGSELATVLQKYD